MYAIQRRFKCLLNGEWYCSRCQAHRLKCVRNCNAAGFFMHNSFLCVSRKVHHPKDNWAALESTRASILVERLRVHAQPIEAVLRGKKGRGLQLYISKVFLMFGILNVF